MFTPEDIFEKQRWRVLANPKPLRHGATKEIRLVDMRTGLKRVKLCGDEGVEECLPSRRVETDVVHGTGQDQETLPVQLERAAIVRDRGSHRAQRGAQTFDAHKGSYP